MRCLIGLFLLLGPAIAAAQVDSSFTFPAEWGPHRAVWLGWNHPARRDTVSAQIIRALTPTVPVKLLVKSDSVRRAVAGYLQRCGVDTNRVRFVLHPYPNFWVRDPGPLFLRNPAGQQAVALFNWNSYGYPYAYPDFRWENRDVRIGALPGQLAEQLKLPTRRSYVVNEGGAMEVNGRGTLLVVAGTARQRNPGFSLAYIEAEFKRMLGQKKVIWLPQSPIHDIATSVDNYILGGANGHIDEFCRFADERTILLAKVGEDQRRANPVHRIDYDRLEAAYQVLRKATDQDGRPFRILRVPVPDFELFVELDTVRKETASGELRNFKPGQIVKYAPSVSYLNFLVSNGVVLIAKYWRAGLPESLRRQDEEVHKLFGSLYPNRRVVAIHTLAVNRSGGGIHCATQQEPE